MVRGPELVWESNWWRMSISDKDVMLLGQMAINSFPVWCKCWYVSKRAKTTRIKTGYQVFSTYLFWKNTYTIHTYLLFIHKCLSFDMPNMMSHHLTLNSHSRSRKLSARMFIDWREQGTIEQKNSMYLMRISGHSHLFWFLMNGEHGWRG